jgi:hypothetical protein
MIRLYEVEAEKRAGFLFKRTKDGEVYVVGEDAYDAANRARNRDDVNEVQSVTPVERVDDMSLRAFIDILARHSENVEVDDIEDEVNIEKEDVDDEDTDEDEYAEQEERAT